MPEPDDCGAEILSKGESQSGLFPPTRWTFIKDSNRSNYVAERYWRPVFCYLLSRGLSRDQAEELAQSFFAKCVEKDSFAKANPSRGRFRSFLLTALKNHVSNEIRDAHAQKRHPEAGFIPAHELRTDEGPCLVPADRENPETAFNRAWTSELVLRVLGSLEAEYAASGMKDHLRIFRESIIDPALRGEPVPSMRKLAEELGLTEKQAHNRLLAARRAYQRLLREEIRSFASSEAEVAAEVQDLFRFLAKA